MFFGYVMIAAASLHAVSAVAVMPFQSEQAQLGESLAARVLTSLENTKKFTIVERGQLKKALDEIARGQSGLVRDEDVLKIGEMAGAEYLVVGEAHRNGETYSGTLRVIKAETAIVIGAQSASGTLDQVTQKLSDEAINSLAIYLLLDNPDSPYTVLLKLDRGQNPVYRVGETLKLTFKVLKHRTAASTVYIQIFAINSLGAMTMIYPNKFAQQQRIEVDREYTFPRDQDDFEWALDPPPGTEYIQAIVTNEPSDVFNMQKRSTSEEFPEVRGVNGRTEAHARSINTRIRRDRIRDWAAERISYQLQAP